MVTLVKKALRRVRYRYLPRVAAALMFVPFLFLLVPVLYVFELFRPVRIANLDSMRVGHFTGPLDIFLRKIELKKIRSDCFYIFTSPRPAANQTVMNLFKKKLNIIESTFLSWIHQTMLPYLRYTRFHHDLSYDYSAYEVYDKGTVPVAFSDEEEKLGQQKLREMGIGPNDWFVCFHARDANYVYKWFNQAAHSGKYTQADFAFSDYRNENILTYLKAMRYISKQGGYALRMGAIVEKPLPQTGDPKIIDYATQWRSDFMDTYLLAKCKFLLFDSAGLYTISTLFNRPVVLANYLLSSVPVGLKIFFQYKKFWDKKQNAYVSFNELQRQGVASGMKHGDFLRHLIKNRGKFISNTDDEILNLVVESNEILDGVRTPNAPAQKAIRGFYNSGYSKFDQMAILSGLYFEKNRELFE